MSPAALQQLQHQLQQVNIDGDIFNKKMQILNIIVKCVLTK